MKSDHPTISRREALKSTLLFSSSFLVGGLANKSWGSEPQTDFSTNGINLLAFGDYGSKNDKQRQVAKQMAKFAAQLKEPLTGILALGDNFYGKFLPEQFRDRFSKIYPKKDFSCPFYALLGNHDYGPRYDSGQGRAKAEMQLARTQEQPRSRWKMPAKWHSFELPLKGKPLVKIIYLDGNYFEGALTPQEKIAQKRWLKKEMAKPTEAPWLWLASHYPIFSETDKRGDKAGAKLLKEWEPYLKDKRVSLYLAGHDHNLQHLRMEGFSPEFIVTGGGGATRYDVSPSNRGFTMKTRGFNHIHVTEELLTVQFINPDGEKVHSFQRDLKGNMKPIPV